MLTSNNLLLLWIPSEVNTLMKMKDNVEKFDRLFSLLYVFTCSNYNFENNLSGHYHYHYNNNYYYHHYHHYYRYYYHHYYYHHYYYYYHHHYHLINYYNELDKDIDRFYNSIPSSFKTLLLLSDDEIGINDDYTRSGVKYLLKLFKDKMIMIMVGGSVP